MNVAYPSIDQRAGRTVYIASIHFLSFTHSKRFKSKPNGGYSTDYELKAVTDPNGCPFILPVTDAVENTYVAEGIRTDLPEYAKIIAEDVVGRACDGILGNDRGLSPGIWVVATANVPSDEDLKDWGTAVFDATFPEFVAEVKAARKKQKLWAQFLVFDADDKDIKGDKTNIGTLPRAAAAWLGVDARLHKWMQDLSERDIVACPFCRGQIEATASICQICHQVVDQDRFNLQKDVISRIAEEKRKILAEADEVASPVPAPRLAKPPIQPPISVGK